MQKYEAKKRYLIIYLCLIAIDAFCMLSRWLNSINPQIKLLPGFLLSHITDLALCMMVLLIIGFVILCFGGRLRIVSIAALLIAVLGIIYECFLPFLKADWDTLLRESPKRIIYAHANEKSF